MKHYRLLLCIIVPVITFAQVSVAETIEWTSSAVACIPSANTVKTKRYETSEGRVKFKEGTFGSISFICPISHPLKNGEYILKAYTSYSGGKGETLIALKQCSKKDHSISDILNAIALTAEPGTIYRTQSSTLQQITFNNKEFYYWVEIAIHQHDKDGEQTVSGVELIRQ
jgi:hypothetical protein